MSSDVFLWCLFRCVCSLTADTVCIRSPQGLTNRRVTLLTAEWKNVLSEGYRWNESEFFFCAKMILFPRMRHPYFQSGASENFCITWTYFIYLFIFFYPLHVYKCIIMSIWFSSCLQENHFFALFSLVWILFVDRTLIFFSFFARVDWPHKLQKEKGFGLSVLNHNIVDKKCEFLLCLLVRL